MKNLLLSVTAAVAAALMLASCAAEPTASVTAPATASVTASATAPAKSADELVAEYRRLTDEKIAEIKAAQAPEIPEGATVYYVSPDGKASSDGLSPETAWKKLGEKQLEKLKSGDFVLFQRGSVYRGQIQAVAGVTYSSYGEGAKPMIYGCTKNVGSPEYWRETDESGVWKLALTVQSDVGDIVFGGTETARKLNFDYASDGSATVHGTGAPFADYRDLTEDMTFWHDPATWALYLRCNAGNPGEIYGDIELCPYAEGGLIKIKDADNVTVDGLVIKYTGGHGIGAGNVTGLTVRNCEFYFIGGASMHPEDKPAGRLGNGVEIFGDCDGYTVENCYFDNMYDTGATFQWTPVKADHPSNVMVNIVFRGNVMERCNYSIEYFQTVTDGSYIGNIVFEDNYCWYAGEGLCEQRPDAGGEAHIKSWHSDCNTLNGYFEIRNNVFAYSKPYLVQLNACEERYMPTLSGNVFIQAPGRPVVSWYGERPITDEAEAKSAMGDDAAVIIIAER